MGGRLSHLAVAPAKPVFQSDSMLNRMRLSCGDAESFGTREKEHLLHGGPVPDDGFSSQFAKMSLPKPFSQCSLSDLAPAIAHASAASVRALDPATADRLLPVLRNATLTEAVLLRHPLVRDRSGLKCDGSAYSKRAWCGMLRDLVAAASVDASDAALLRVYLVCKECAKLERAQLCSNAPASAAAEDGGALVASPAPAAAPRSASSSLSAARAPPLTFTYRDRFLGKVVCIPVVQHLHHDRFLGKAVCIPVVQHLQICGFAAPLMLVTPSLHFARGRAAAGATPQHPAPPVDRMLVELWPAQRTRFMFGFTLKACDRASIVDPCAIEYFRAASRWSAGMLLRVMSGYCSKVQVRWVLRARRAALVLLTRAAANAGRLSGWMRASASALPAASRLHPGSPRSLPPCSSGCRRRSSRWQGRHMGCCVQGRHFTRWRSRSRGRRMREQEGHVVRPTPPLYMRA
jgi:hypothetical protein